MQSSISWHGTNLKKHMNFYRAFGAHFDDLPADGRKIINRTVIDEDRLGEVIKNIVEEGEEKAV